MTNLDQERSDEIFILETKAEAVNKLINNHGPLQRDLNELKMSFYEHDEQTCGSKQIWIQLSRRKRL